MSFQIKEKKKIALLRKCVQILTYEKEDFYMHFTKTHVSIFLILFLTHFVCKYRYDCLIFTKMIQHI